MKSFLRGLLLLIIGAGGGYYLGVTHPEYTELPSKIGESIPFLNKAKDTLPAMEADSLLQTPDSMAVAMGRADCVSGDSFQQRLLRVTENIEAKKYPYRADLGQDCSGIFHKIKDSVDLWTQSQCEDSNFVFPDYDSTRSSRAIADWYYEKGNLTLVEDPMKVRNQIVPGSVMFYSKPGKTYTNLNIEKLTGKSNNYSPASGAIMHIGVVVDVTKDEEGNVVQYTLMHGRNERHPASRTDYHKEVQSKNQTLPKFGNWSQQWVAIASVVTEGV